MLGNLALSSTKFPADKNKIIRARGTMGLVKGGAFLSSFSFPSSTSRPFSHLYLPNLFDLFGTQRDVCEGER